MKYVFSIYVCLILSVQLWAQEKTDIPTKEEKTIEWLDNILQINKPLEPNLHIPYFEIGAGIFNFHGDVNNFENRNFTVGSPGINFSLIQPINSFINFKLNYLHGTITGNYYPQGLQYGLNFNTKITSFGTSLEYNFTHIKSLPLVKNRTISPYLGIGIEALQRAEPWGDIYSDTIRTYVWKDGTIRDRKESDYSSSNSNIVYRDYIFESSYERENIDKIEYFTPISFSFPIDLGLEFNISDFSKMRLGYQYHITSSNLLDNISNKGDYTKNPERKSVKNHDAFSNAYISVVIDIESAGIEKIKLDTTYKSPFKEFWDADKDGIDETEDDCPYTPSGVQVFANGCPLDDDKDKTPNYRDNEKNTRAFYSNINGVGFSERELLDQMRNVKKVEQKEIYRFYPKLLIGGTVYKQFYKKIPWKFKILDSDKNEYIDIDEMLTAIDTFFDDDSIAAANLNVKDLYELIEFFFLQ